MSLKYEPASEPQAIDNGKPIPTELREEEAELRHQIELEDEKSAVPWSVSFSSS